jgi:hypothetical protein
MFLKNVRMFEIASEQQEEFLAVILLKVNTAIARANDKSGRRRAIKCQC